jgi:hypothetical protein
VSVSYIDIQSRGKSVRVPSIHAGARNVVVLGRWLRIASIQDEALVDGGVDGDPKELISSLATSRLRADLLTFSQKVYESTPRHPYYFDWDNAALACTTSFDAWWSALPQESRKNVRRAARRGLTVRIARLDETFARGIKDIYDEAPIRQGRRFWHYGKDFETVRGENSTYLDRSEFLGAYSGDELVGFMKFVYVGRVAVMMQILSKIAHADSRPVNALIAKAVEVCADKGIAYLMYGKYTYGNKTGSQLAEFKRRNGFVQMDYPRYYVPLTLRGRLAVRLGLHRGLLGLLPPSVIASLWRVRSMLLRARPEADQAGALHRESAPPLS